MKNNSTNLMAIMTDKEKQAHDLVRCRNWLRAATLYDEILASAPTWNRVQKDRHIICLLGRCECLYELGKYEPCLADARKLLSMISEQQPADCLTSVSRTRKWQIHALCKLKKYVEAEKTLKEWIAQFRFRKFNEICNVLEGYRLVVNMLYSYDKSEQKLMDLAFLDDKMASLDNKLDNWASKSLALDKYSKHLCGAGGGVGATGATGSNTNIKGIKKRENPTPNGGGPLNNMSGLMLASLGVSSASSNKTATADDAAATSEDANSTTCSYCAITFSSRNELRQHCQTEAHQNVIMSDEGRDWKWRPPPRGFTLDSYSLCESWTESQLCHYGNQCVEAHGQDELNEWKERFEYRRMRLQKACEKELYGKSYTEQILEKWIQSTAPEKIMCEKVDGIEANCEQDLVTSISSKTSKREWVFVLKTTGKTLKAVALLQDAHRSHFALKSIKTPDTTYELDAKTNQEWMPQKLSTSSSSTSTSSSEKEESKKSTTDSNAESSSSSSSTCTTNSTPVEHHVTVEFHTEIYGTFRQAVCFDFGSEPILVRHLCVDVVPVSDAEKIEEIKRDIINSSATRWDVSNTHLVKFETTIGTHMKTEGYLNDLKHEKEMLERYPCPRAQTFTLTQSTILDKRLTQNNYRSRIHELLYVEEIARYEQIARFNLRTKLNVTSNYILTPAGMATSTAKYSLSGELFALMHLGKDVSEDTSAGRLILSNCSSVYISVVDEANLGVDKKRHVYEAVIEDKGKNVIYLKLSSKCVEALKLKADTELHVDIQFQLNRLPYCEWHHAVDKITDFKIIFPATEVEPNIPWTPKKQWSESCEPKLNAKQREAVNAITTTLSIKLPPILLIGPFGTGKTYTLAQAIKQLLTQPEAKILICTHSNSAADLYIKEYLHPWIEAGLEEATPLRVYYHKRWVATVNSVVQKYCITDGAGNFRRPTVEDIMKHRIVVVTLSISMELANLDLPKGYFTHIFLDEAAQAMECEAIMPLALANDSTRIVLAGDHMQMSPELFSAFAKERKLHISLLERLYDHYPSNFPCKILLCENYRAHEAIIKFTSELFYEQKLIASGKQPRHEKFYPLTFFTTRGEDVQDKNSTAFYNNSEVYEVVERVSELRKKWPSSWGKINDASIGIMTPYADQVFRIRSELRKRRMGGISVERVLNVQGKQFRAIFLSTVRTRRTCLPIAGGSGVGGTAGGGGFPGQSSSPSEDADYGFLSNSKLLNTAITRAQSLVAVVGDPVALCSIGRCRKVWERFIEICDENKSLFGITMWQLRSQLDGVELKRGYVLNPLAPEFIPRSLQPEAYLRDQAAMYYAMAANNHHPMGPHPGHHHGPGGMGPHPSLLPGGGSGQIPPHHAAAMANQQMPHMYGPHSAAAAAYNAAAAAAAVMMNQGMVGGKGGHHFHGHPNHMPMRAIGPPPAGGPQQPPQSAPPMSGQQFNPRGPPPPPVHLGQPPPNGAGGNQFSQYMPWQHAQQQQLRPPGSGGNFGSAPGQQSGVPTGQNPNASLWGPPPQSNPWTVLPKQQQMQQPPNPNGANGRQMGSQQTGQNMRGQSVPLQPPPLSNQQQMRNNPNDLGYLANKALYAGKQHPGQGAQVPPTQVHSNFGGFGGQGNAPPPPPNQLQMMNQRNMSGIPNGPISPMDPFMPRPPAAGGAAPNQNAAFFGQNNLPGPMKDKDFQFLNNVHVPLNIGGTMFQAPPPPPNAMVGSANKQQSPTALRFPQPHEYASLLPPNMNIYEMAFEPKESQYKWYLKLLETQGQDAANKFTEVLRQVSTMMQQQQPQPQQPVNKPPQHLQQTYMNNMGVQPQPPTQQQQQQLMPRDASFMQPLMSYQQQQPPQQQQQPPQRNVNPFMGPLPPPSNPMPSNVGLNDETPPLDINFNQQIDMVFNSILNGNEISQPILRDLFGVAGGSSSNNAGPSAMNGGDMILNSNSSSSNNLLGGSKIFPNIGTGGSSANGVGGGGGPAVMNNHQGNMAKNTMGPNCMLGGMPPQQQGAANPPSGFMGNNSLLNNKEFMLGPNISGGGAGSTSSNSSSVPLYRRQGLTMGNGHNLNSAGNSSASTSGHSLSSSTPDNILNSSPNDILAGLSTGSNTLIEALFQDQHQQQNNATLQKLLYNNFNASGLKGGVGGGDMDLFMGNNSFVNALTDGVANSFHAPNYEQTSANSVNSSGGNNIIGGPNTTATGAAGDGRNTTYAAVLSQGPQAQEALQHHNYAHNAALTTGPGGAAGLVGNGLAGLGLNVNNSANGDGGDKDPFAAIRELGQGTNGFYNYFQ
ncbi:probable helicase with zinc finger domain isoform X1 [Musca domestica]|uniref:Probable helicase with zinc finger domain n=2 Tax=Musca domestica TaxID=7370 RepID=A0A1I8M4I4_MUSDO|nr:probable helicase with zinc finger domain isoform X1 [Musca domestica]XP_019893893.1 probable helicase with zinc finger domain isoform X1 [Musca domestica]